MLSKHGKSVSVIESLAPRLQNQYPVATASDKSNKLIRLAEMLILILKYRKTCKVVLIDTYSTAAFLYAWCVARLCRFLSLPYIPVLHGGNLPALYESATSRVNWFLNHAAFVVSPSVYLQDFFAGKGYPVRHIANFIDIGNYQFIIREKIRPKILWVRSFQPIYNPSLAIEILKLLKEKFPEAQLCMVGGGSIQITDSIHEQIRELNLQKNVKITGTLQKKEWITLSQEYDFFINTASIDNMPVSVIEAMALGLVVISNRVGGIPFLIDHESEGLLVTPGSIEEFVKSITRLINDPLLARQLQQNARKKAERYDWSVVGNSWSELLTQYLK